MDGAKSGMGDGEAIVPRLHQVKSVKTSIAGLRIVDGAGLNTSESDGGTRDHCIGCIGHCAGDVTADYTLCCGLEEEASEQQDSNCSKNAVESVRSRKICHCVLLGVEGIDFVQRFALASPVTRLRHQVQCAGTARGRPGVQAEGSSRTTREALSNELSGTHYPRMELEGAVTSDTGGCDCRLAARGSKHRRMLTNIVRDIEVSSPGLASSSRDQHH